MPRLSQNPELLRAAQMAKVGPKTWQSWKNAGEKALEIFKDLAAGSMAGDVLRGLGVEMPPKPSDMESLEQNILDFGIPNAPVGQIKRLSHAIRKGEKGGQAVRDIMAKEMKARGVAKSDEWLDSLLRSTPFHGRSYEHYPTTGELYNPGAAKAGNVGEPHGISLTYLEPNEFAFEHSFAKTPKKYKKVEDTLTSAGTKLAKPVLVIDRQIAKLDATQLAKSAKGELTSELLQEISAKRKQLFAERDKLAASKHKQSYAYAKQWLGDRLQESPPMARVLPRFHAPPTQAVIKGWKGSGDEQPLQEAYKYALRQMPELWSKGVQYSQDEVARVLPKSKAKEVIEITDLANDLVNKPSILGALYHFLINPKEAALSYNFENFYHSLPTSYQAAVSDLVKGKTLSPFFQTKLNRLEKLRDVLEKSEVSLNTHKLPSYTDLKQALFDRPMRQKFNTHLTNYLRSKGYRGVLYSPSRYEEYELRMLDPRDVVQLDIRQTDDPALMRMYKATKKDQAIKDWSKTSANQAKAASPHALGTQPYALGAVYKDIDLGTLEPWDAVTREQAALEVLAGVQTAEAHTLKDKIPLGHLGEKRVRQKDIPEF